MKKIFIIALLVLPMLIGSITSCDKEIDAQLLRRSNNESYFNSFADSTDYKKVSAPGTYGDNYVYVKKLKNGSSDANSPIYTSSVEIRYKTYMLESWLRNPNNTTPISSNYNQEVLFPISISNLTMGEKIALQSMKIGDHIHVAIPWYLGYGDRLYHGIPSFSSLFMDIELVKIDE